MTKTNTTLHRMQKKDGFLHVRLDADIKDHVEVLKARPGGLSRFINDKIREDKLKAEKNGV